MVEFKNKILIVGFGAVAQCALPILTRHIKAPFGNMTVMDFEDRSKEMKPWVEQGMKFVRDKVTEDNMGSLLGSHLKAGDLLIDLAWNIDACAILQWCHDNGVLYVNTSVELWDPYAHAEKGAPNEMTLYWRHMNIDRMISKWGRKGPTAVVEHGANPGLISHWTKQGLIDIADRMLEDGKAKGAEAESIRQHMRDGAFNHLAMALGVKVIHCSERDTQITNVPKEVNEFVNTWSIEGFREEGTTTAELGWGTHEKELPAFAVEHKDGPKNQICLAKMGMNTWVRTWVPGHCINGMVVRHGEAYTISKKLTVTDKEGRAIYRPTMHYAYCPCDAAIVSLQELRGYDYELQPKLRILNDEITSGSDILGALIMGHAYNSWWTGSDLSIEESRTLVPHQNATTMQVAISVTAAAKWMIENPEEGFKVPDELPHTEILATARPYLGKNLSVQSDWTPLTHYKSKWGRHAPADIDTSDPWQFKNFLVKE